MVYPKAIVLILMTLFSLIPNAPAGRYSAIGAADPSFPDIPAPAVGHNGGAVSSITVRGEYAYLSIGAEVAILSIADAGHPVRVGSLPIPDGSANMVAIAGHYAYYVNRNRLLVIDIAQPSAPTVVASLPIEAFSFSSQVVVVGHYLYLVGYGLLKIVDIAMPLAPVEVSSIPFDGFPIRVLGSYAYIGLRSEITLGPGLQVLDLSHPTAPVQIGVYRTALPPAGIHYDVTGLAVENGYAYMLYGQCPSCPSEQAEVVGIANPSAPKRVGGLPTGPSELTVAGGYAYMADKNVLRVVDVSHPAAPVQIAAYPAGTKGLYGMPLVAVQGHYAYYAAEDGLEIVDVANPAAPNTVGSYSQLIYADGVAVAGHYAYVAAGYAGLAVLDIADPTNPTLVGRLGFSAWENVLAVAGHYAYLYSWDTSPPGGGSQRLLVVDVGDPAAPKLVGSLTVGSSRIGSGGAVAIAVMGPYVYLASPDGLKIVDTANPSVPKLVGTLPAGSPSLITDLVVAGRHAYLADQERGVIVVDISNPAKPAQVGLLPLMFASRLALAGRYIYAATGAQLTIIDIINPAVPQQVAQLTVPGGDLAVDGRYLYIVSHYIFQVVDVANPAAPADAGAYYLENHGQADIYSSLVAAADGYVYAASGHAGLFVIRLGHAVSGRLTHANGLPAPLAGVMISAGVGLTATTDLSGAYRLDNIPSNLHTLTPAATDYRFSPASRTVSVPSDLRGQDFVALTAPASVTLAPGEPASLISIDTQSLPTQLGFPAGALAASTTLVLTPTLAEGPRGWAFAGHAFDLAASQNAAIVPDLVFGAPVTVSISYSPGDARLVSSPSDLALRWWDGTGWQDAAATCNPTTPYARDPIARTVSVGICRTGRFALFGPTRQIYLPQ